MKNVLRVVLGLLALATLALGALAFAVVLGTGDGFGAAAHEAFETVPEAAMQMLGFDGSPLWVDVTYWTALIGGLVFVFRRK
ncbi:MAG TPA: hypothetical protein VM915_06250 [Verrucomicrobiae bacterium]|nr:hypothetical protein [Verrucomicrobiae bacterium]